MPIINQVVAGSGGGSAPRYYIEKTLDANGCLQFGSTIMDFTGVKSLGYNVLYYAYSYNNNISGEVRFPDLESVTENNGANIAFSGSQNITGVYMPKLESVTSNSGCGQMFSGCRGNTVAYLPKLKTIGSRYSGYLASCFNMFADNNITGVVDLSSLEFVGGGNAATQMFNSNRNITGIILTNLYEIYNTTGSAPMSRFITGAAITELRFPSLALIGHNALASFAAYTSNLASVWFYALDTNSFGSYTDQFNNMIQAVTGCSVHFPIRVQSTIGSWSDVTNGFGGTNTTVLFDIVTTLTGADGNTYTRQEKDSTTTATAWVYNDTLYYTSGVSDNANGVNEPAVSDAIYSDAACTQSVTTITAIS